jgi:hypothetical protein
VYRVLGRDPVTSPLSDLEWQVFYRTTLEHVETEFKPRAERTMMTGHPGNE